MPAPRLQYSSIILQLKGNQWDDQAAHSSLQNLIRQLQTLFQKVVSVLAAETTDFGATGTRPALPGNLHPGSSFFDTSLGANGKPIWVDKTGLTWVDATGASV